MSSSHDWAITTFNSTIRLQPIIARFYTRIRFISSLIDVLFGNLSLWQLFITYCHFLQFLVSFLSISAIIQNSFLLLISFFIADFEICAHV